MYVPPCCAPSALHVCVRDVCVREVCGPPVSCSVCVCVGAGILGGVDVGRWLPGVPALVVGVDVGLWRPSVPALEHRPGFAVLREGVDVLGALCRRLVLASDPSAHVCVDGDPQGGVAAVDHDVNHFRLPGVLCYVFVEINLFVLRARLLPCLWPGEQGLWLGDGRRLRDRAFRALPLLLNR